MQLFELALLVHVVGVGVLPSSGLSRQLGRRRDELAGSVRARHGVGGARAAPD